MGTKLAPYGLTHATGGGLGEVCGAPSDCANNGTASEDADQRNSPRAEMPGPRLIPRSNARASVSPSGAPDRIDDVFQLILESAMANTGAAGAAIAIGNSTFMECRATVGAAPARGVALYPDAGVSGLCLRTGTVVHCADALSDPRVDAAVAARLGMRSVVILPIHISGEIAGVLELFSPAPNTFQTEEMKGRLEFLAELLTKAIEEHELTDTQASYQPGSEVEIAKAPLDTEETRLLESPLFPSHLKIPVLVAAIAFLVFATAWYYAQKHAFLAKLASAPTQHSNLAMLGSPTTKRVQKGPPTVIGFGPSKIVERVGASFAVDVLLKDAQDVSSVPLQIAYNPKMLQFVGVAFGDLLNADGQSGTLVHRADPIEGKIHIAASRPPSTPGISGNGVVCTLMFLAKARGRSNLTINQGTLRDPAMQAIPANTSNATVTISR